MWATHPINHPPATPTNTHTRPLQTGGGENDAGAANTTTADAAAEAADKAEARARAREKAMMVIARMLDVDSTLVPAGER